MKSFTIVIPTFDESEYLSKLLNSVKCINYPSNYFEVIVVNDGSPDNTKALVESQFPDFRLINLEENVGRYQARKIGAENANFENLLYVDTRALVDPNILSVINATNSKAIKGRVVCGNPNNFFHVLFESIRYKLYPKFYKKRSGTFQITKDNFETLPKGTTIFYVEKDILVSAFEDLANLPMGKISSDDTLLLKTINQYIPILYHPDVKITHYIRSSFGENFLHLIYRGSTFVFYYLHPSKRLFWLVIVFPIIFFSLLLLCLINLSPPWQIILGFFLTMELIASLYLGKTMRERLVIFFMIPVCVTAFYAGVIRGVFLKLFRSQ